MRVSSIKTYTKPLSCYALSKVISVVFGNDFEPRKYWEMPTYVARKGIFRLEVGAAASKLGRTLIEFICSINR